MSDEVYDMLIVAYRRRYKEETTNSFDKSVGLPKIDSSRAGKRRMKLPFEVGRTIKMVWGHAGVDDRFAKWKKVYGTSSIVVSHKLDGCSGVYANVNGTHTFQTREGIDISHLLPLFRLPSLPKHTGVRGEIIMNRDVFMTKWEAVLSEKRGSRSTPRGAVSGQFGAQDSVQPALIADFHFVVYEFIESSVMIQKKRNAAGLAFAASLGFEVVRHVEWTSKQLTLERLRTALAEARLQTDYDIDGLVVTYNGAGPDRSDVNTEDKPNYVFAFKENPKGVMVTVNEVTWEAGRTWRIAPRVVYDEVWLGSNVHAANAHNARYVFDNKLGPGAVVRIAKSGDVIPNIMSIVSPAPGGPSMPTIDWHWDANKVMAIAGKEGEDPPLSDNIIIAQLSFFLSSMGVKHVASAMVKALFESGRVTSITDMLKLDGINMRGIAGIGDKKIARIRKGVRDAIATCPFETFLASIQVLGTGLGKRKLKRIVPHLPELMKEGVVFTPAFFQKYKGIGAVFAKQLANRWPLFTKFWKKEVPSVYQAQLLGTALMIRTNDAAAARRRAAEEEEEEESEGDEEDEKVEEAEGKGEGRVVTRGEETDIGSHDSDADLDKLIFDGTIFGGPRRPGTMEAARRRYERDNGIATTKVTGKKRKVKKVKKVKKARRDPMAGQKVLLTGFRDAEITAFLGDHEASGFSKSLTMLVIKDESVHNKKVQKAEKAKICIVTRDAFKAKYMS